MVNYDLTNSHIFERTGLLLIEIYVELRRTKWLEKDSNINKDIIPRKLLGFWLPYTQRNGNAGKPQQIIQHAYVHTLKRIRFENSNLSKWMEIAKSREDFEELVNYTYRFVHGTHDRTNVEKKMQH